MLIYDSTYQTYNSVMHMQYNVSDFKTLNFVGFFNRMGKHCAVARRSATGHVLLIHPDYSAKAETVVRFDLKLAEQLLDEALKANNNHSLLVYFRAPLGDKPAQIDVLYDLETKVAMVTLSATLGAFYADKCMYIDENGELYCASELSGIAAYQYIRTASEHMNSNGKVTKAGALLALTLAGYGAIYNPHTVLMKEIEQLFSTQRVIQYRFGRKRLNSVFQSYQHKRTKRTYTLSSILEVLIIVQEDRELLLDAYPDALESAVLRPNGIVLLVYKEIFPVGLIHKLSEIGYSVEARKAVSDAIPQ